VSLKVKLERCCVSCQRLAPKGEFWRVVRQQQMVSLDRGGLLQGRSAYICKNFECLNLARKKNKLGRSLKSAIDPELYQQLLELQNSLKPDA
jgi:uncharacterized protein